MKYHPNHIILKQTLRYLSKDEQLLLLSKLSNLQIEHKPFLNCLINNFDIELFKNSALIWQDIWLYNYLKYDIAQGIKKNGLIAKYEREVFIDNDIEFFKKKDELNSNTLSKVKKIKK
jgi:hypothetical protein